jgi:hypothetical protein
LKIVKMIEKERAQARLDEYEDGKGAIRFD